jgi:hypothetical protein
MAITFQLVDATPYRLRYLAFQDGQETESPSDGFAIIPNAGGPSPDLSTDLAGDPSGPLRRIVQAAQPAPIGVFGAPLTQAQARALMLSDDAAGATLANNSAPRAIVTSQCNVRIFNPPPGNPFASPPNQEIEKDLSDFVDFCVDVNVVNGAPVIEVRTPVGAAGFAYIDLYYRHTVDL